MLFRLYVGWLRNGILEQFTNPVSHLVQGKCSLTTTAQVLQGDARFKELRFAADQNGCKAVRACESKLVTKTGRTKGHLGNEPRAS